MTNFKGGHAADCREPGTQVVAPPAGRERLALWQATHTSLTLRPHPRAWVN